MHIHVVKPENLIMEEYNIVCVGVGMGSKKTMVPQYLISCPKLTLNKEYILSPSKAFVLFSNIFNPDYPFRPPFQGFAMKITYSIFPFTSLI